MNAKELVFGALSEEIGKEDLGAKEAMRQEISLEAADLLGYLEKARQALSSGQNIWDQTALFVVLADQSIAREPAEGFLGMLLEAHSADRGCPDSQDRLQKILLDLEEGFREEIYEEGRDAAVYGWDASLEYIVGIWGSEAAHILAKATGAQLATARRWLRGGTANGLNTRRVAMLAGLSYDLQHRLDWDSEQVRLWMKTPLPGSRSPLQIWKSTRYFRLAPAIEAEIKRLGLLS